jgi:transcriptional regulator with XRE-family HTH domain
MIRLRTEAGWSVAELARRAGLRAAWIDLIERDRSTSRSPTRTRSP